MLLYEKPADEIVRQNPELAIVPIGSIEQHGPHLPVMTDFKIAEYLGRAVAEKTGGFSIPPLPVSTCREHMGKKGSVWMSATTFMAMIRDIAMSLREQGFKRIALLQCHGGIFALGPIVRELNGLYNPDLQVALIDVCTFFPILFQEGILQTSTELHAGECETSQMLFLAPETVDMSRAVDFVPDAPRPYLNYGSIFRFCPQGVWGEPTKATAEKGKAVMERMAELSCRELEKIFRFMDGKEPFGYSQF